MSARFVQENRKRFFDVETEHSDGIVFVNWIAARNVRGFFMMWRYLLSIYLVTKRATGLQDSYFGLVSPARLMLVTYWENEAALHEAYKDPAHVAMMRYTFQHPDDFALGNETYRAPYSTRYLNEQRGFARVGQSEAWTQETFLQHHGTATVKEALK